MDDRSGGKPAKRAGIHQARESAGTGHGCLVRALIARPRGGGGGVTAAADVAAETEGEGAPVNVVVGVPGGLAIAVTGPLVSSSQSPPERVIAVGAVRRRSPGSRRRTQRGRQQAGPTRGFASGSPQSHDG